MENLIGLVLIMITVGITCGITVFLREKEYSKSAFFVNILYGIIATLVVPLFLNLISSDIVKSIIDGADIFKYQLLIFIGFCAIAALYSKSFLERMYNKITEDLNKVKKDIKETKNEIEVIQHGMEEKPDIVKPKKEAISEFSKEDEAAFEKMYLVMESIYKSSYVYRTISGISKETKLENDELVPLLMKMKKIGFILIKISKKGEKLYGLSDKGLDVFENDKSD